MRADFKSHFPSFEKEGAMVEKILPPILFALSVVVAGCASNAPKTMRMDDGHEIVIGYMPQEQLGPGYFVIAERDSNGHWRAVKIAASMQTRSTESQEVLYVSKNLGYIQPYFDNPKGYYPDQGYFQCGVLMSATKEYAGYSPCGKTALTTAKAGSTLGQNLFAVPLTLGTASGTTREVDRDLIARIAHQVDLLEVVGAFKDLQDAQVGFDNELRDYHRKLVNGVKWDIQVEDRSGFYAGNADFTKLARFAFKPFPSVSSVENSSLGITAEIGWRRKELEAAYQEHRRSYSAGVSCPKDTTFSNFNIFIRECGKNITNEVDLTQPMRMSVVVNSANFMDVRPRFQGGDDNIDVRYERSGIRFTNKSQKYIDVLSVSVYWNDKILTKYAMHDITFTIPPSAYVDGSLSAQVATIERDVSSFLNGKNDYRDMTVSNAKNGNVNFGFAVKYRVGGSERYKSFFKTHKYPLLDLLSVNHSYVSTVKSDR